MANNSSNTPGSPVMWDQKLLDEQAEHQSQMVDLEKMKRYANNEIEELRELCQMMLQMRLQIRQQVEKQGAVPVGSADGGGSSPPDEIQQYLSPVQSPTQELPLPTTRPDEETGVGEEEGDDTIENEVGTLVETVEKALASSNLQSEEKEDFRQTLSFWRALATKLQTHFPVLKVYTTASTKATREAAIQSWNRQQRLTSILTRGAKKLQYQKETSMFGGADPADAEKGEEIKCLDLQVLDKLRKIRIIEISTPGWKEKFGATTTGANVAGKYGTDSIEVMSPSAAASPAAAAATAQPAEKTAPATKKKTSMFDRLFGSEPTKPPQDQHVDPNTTAAAAAGLSSSFAAQAAASAQPVRGTEEATHVGFDVAINPALSPIARTLGMDDQARHMCASPVMLFRFTCFFFPASGSACSSMTVTPRHSSGAATRTNMNAPAGSANAGAPSTSSPSFLAMKNDPAVKQRLANLNQKFQQFLDHRCKDATLTIDKSIGLLLEKVTDEALRQHGLERKDVAQLHLLVCPTVDSVLDEYTPIPSSSATNPTAAATAAQPVPVYRVQYGFQVMIRYGTGSGIGDGGGSKRSDGATLLLNKIWEQVIFKGQQRMAEVEASGIGLPTPEEIEKSILDLHMIVQGLAHCKSCVCFGARLPKPDNMGRQSRKKSKKSNMDGSIINPAGGTAQDDDEADLHSPAMEVVRNLVRPVCALFVVPTTGAAEPGAETPASSASPSGSAEGSTGSPTGVASPQLQQGNACVNEKLRLETCDKKASLQFTTHNVPHELLLLVHKTASYSGVDTSKLIASVEKRRQKLLKEGLTPEQIEKEIKRLQANVNPVELPRSFSTGGSGTRTKISLALSLFDELHFEIVKGKRKNKEHQYIHNQMVSVVWPSVMEVVHGFEDSFNYAREQEMEKTKEETAAAASRENSAIGCGGAEDNINNNSCNDSIVNSENSSFLRQLQGSPLSGAVAEEGGASPTQRPMSPTRGGRGGYHQRTPSNISQSDMRKMASQSSFKKSVDDVDAASIGTSITSLMGFWRTFFLDTTAESSLMRDILVSEQLDEKNIMLNTVDLSIPFPRRVMPQTRYYLPRPSSADPTEELFLNFSLTVRGDVTLDDAINVIAPEE